MMKSNSLANRILALVLTLVMVLGMMPSGFTSADAVSAGLMVYIDPLDEWIEKGYTLQVWSGSDVRCPTDDNGDGIYNFQLPSGWTAFELRVSDEESGYDYIYYTNNMEIPTDDRNLYTAESVEMVDEILGEITGTWSVYTPQSYATVYFKPLQEWIDAGYRFNFTETPYAEFHFFTDSDGDGIYEVSLDSELVDRWRDGSYLHIQVREAGEDGWFSYKYYRQNVMPNDGSNLFTATALDEEYQREIIGTWSVYTPGAVEPETPEVTYVAEVNGTKFETLAAAVAAAAPGETVTLLSNASGAGVVINKDITIDFGGYTYTFTEGVGSTGTESNGFQILSGNTVTLKNGTLNVAEADKSEFYMLIQNYANLTVTDMTLDGINLDKYSGSDGDSYTLSNNSGTVTINGKTNIIANDEGALAYAFDVCQYGSYAVPTVTVNTTGKITGNVQVSEGLEKNLTITGGTYNTDVSAYVPMGWQQDENGTVIVDSVIDTEAELVAAITKGGEVTLGGNIVLTGPVTVSKAVTLNLNGFKLTLPDHSNYGIVVKDSLTINGDGYVHVNGKYGIGLSTSCTGGLTVNGGTFTGAGDCDYMIGAFNGKVTVNGGKFTSAYCVVNSFEGYNATVEINGGTLSADYPVLGVNVDVSDAATLNIGQFLCVIGNTYYHTLEAAVAAVQQGETITMLADTKASFNAGSATGSKPQSFTLDLNGYTLTLGPGVGSSGTTTNGIRVMAYSTLTIRNGNVACSSETADKIKVGIANYGTLVLEDVKLTAGSLTQYTINNRGKLTLSGSTTVTDGSTAAITNDPYDKYYTENFNAELNCASANVTVGNVLVERYARTSNNQGSIVLNISAGSFGTITEDGASAIAVEGKISGGSYGNDVSAYVVDTHASVGADGKFVVRSKQTGFAFDKNNETVAYKEGLTRTISASGGEATGTVTYALSGDCKIATLSGNTLTITGVGTITVTATKAGDDTYAPATATYTLTVVKGEGAINVAEQNVDLTFGTTSYSSKVTTVGTGELSYAITKNENGVDVTIDEKTGVLTFNPNTDKVGTVEITASQEGDDLYNAPESITYNVTLIHAEAPETPVTYTSEANGEGWFGKTLLVTPAEGYQICLAENLAAGGWVPNSIEFTDGIHENVTVYLKDANGHITAPIDLGDLKVDTQAPEVTINVVDAVWETIAGKIFFVTNKDVTVLVSVEDSTKLSDDVSDIADVQISLDGGNEFQSIGAEKAWEIKLSSEYRDFVVVKATDKAGQSGEAKTETIVVDKDAPELSGDLKDVDVTSKLADGTVVHFDNGEKISINYSVTENNLDLANKDLTVTVNGEQKDGWTLSDEGVLEMTLDGEGVYTITATFTDKATNVSNTVTHIYVIDTAAPTVTVDEGEAKDVNGVYFSSAKEHTVTVTVNEALFDTYAQHGVTPTVVVTRNGEAYDKYQITWTGNTAKLVINEDGEYEITAAYQNLIHNEVSDSIKLVVDQAKPVITLTPNAEVESKGVYYTKNSTYGLTITLDEALYAQHGTVPEVTVKRNGEDYSYGALAWTTIEEVLKLSENGVYEITVNYENRLHKADTKKITVVVDLDAPIITLKDNADVEADGIFYTRDPKYGLTISLTEDLYAQYLKDEFKPTVTVTKDRESYTEYPDMGWDTTEDTLYLSENGVYKVVVNYENHLQKAESKEITVVVDLDAPVITLTPDIETKVSDVYYTSTANYGLKISLNEDLYAQYLIDGFKPVVKVNGDVVPNLEWNTTEETLTLNQNGVYNVEVSYKNHLYEAKTEEITIVVDLDTPVITLTPDIETKVSDVYYTSTANYGLKISLTEDLYAQYLTDNVKPVITVTRNGETYTGYPAMDWNTTEDTLYLTENGVYKVVVDYKNHLYEAKTEEITIVVDLDVPDITLTPDIETVYDNVYYTNSENYGLKISLTEDLYDQYLTDNVKPVITVTKDGEAYTDYAAMSWHTTEDTLYLPEEGVYVVTVNYENHLHKAETETINICVDRTLPEVAISYKDVENPNVRPSRVDEKTGKVAVFGENTTVIVTVNEVNFDVNATTVTLNGTPYAGTWTSDGAVHTFEIPLNTDGNHMVEVTTADYATNANDSIEHLGEDVQYALMDVDTGAPEKLEITYETSVWEGFINKITFGMFYGNQTTVTVHATDLVSGVKTFAFEYILATNVGAPNAGSEAPIVVDASDAELIYDAESDAYAYRFTIPTEALTDKTQFNGYLQFTATDWAGKTTSFNTLDKEVEDQEELVDYHVIVDNINPVGRFDLNAAVNTTGQVAYYNGNIVLNINIHEANFFAQDVQIAVTKDGTGYTGYRLAGWNGGSNTLTLTEDGDYRIGINYADRSRNPMNAYVSGNLTLDTVAPVITVSNIEQNSANKDETYGFTITVTDINLDADSVKPSLTAVVRGEDGLYSTETIELGAAQRSADGQTVTFTVENLEKDALYTLNCTAEDMSDNRCSEIVLEDAKAYETVNFSVNRNGSTYGFGTDYMTDLVEKYYVYSVYEDLVIVEVNVDPIETYTVTVNGTELVENVDYTTEQTSKNGEWSKRTYTIKKEKFADEGEYNVIVSSVDKAETTAYSDIKDLAVAFVVDQTAPLLNISGLQTGGRYQTEEQFVTLQPTDEGGRLNSLKVVVMDSDGKPLTNEEGVDISVRFEASGDKLLDYLSDNGDLITFTIPSGLEHQVQIVCNDCAVNQEGLTNEYNETFERVTVSQNALIIFYANKPAFYGTLAGLAAMIILIIVLVKRKKNDKK